jgi:hypothetical protein
MSVNLNAASAQWASRPNDERFLTLADLKAAVARRKDESWTATPKSNALRVNVDDRALKVDVYDPTKGQVSSLTPTHWGFGQLSQYASAPASYLRTLPPELAAINLQWGLEHNPVRDDTLLLAQTNGDNVLRSLTSVSYGRIWDAQVVKAVEKVNEDGRWQVPTASYSHSNPLRATTLYASDRDVFIFLVDPANPIEVEGETLFRGFYTWNSEVGSAVFGLTTFLYRTVCDNRIIWGATNVRELRIRHTGGAPERFGYEGQRYLRQYANEDTAQIVAGIKAAKHTDIPVNAGKGETVDDWLRDRFSFTKAQATAAVQTANAEEGRARTIWDIVQGITAYARSIPHQDARVDLETKAGKLLTLAASKAEPAKRIVAPGRSQPAQDSDVVDALWSDTSADV